MKKLFLFLLLIAALASCGTAKQISTSNIAHGSQALQNSTKLDSIYIFKHDSIFTRIKGDTVYISKTSFRYRDRWHLKTDSINRTDTLKITNQNIITKTIAVEKKLSWFEHGFMILGKITMVILLLTVLYFAVKIYLRLKPKIIS